jgi:hypothetical protein
MPGKKGSRTPFRLVPFWERTYGTAFRHKNTSGSTAVSVLNLTPPQKSLRFQQRRNIWNVKLVIVCKKSILICIKINEKVTIQQTNQPFTQIMYFLFAVSFGGTVTLFLGCSILSGVEFFYYFTLRLGCKFWRKYQKKSKIHPLTKMQQRSKRSAVWAGNMVTYIPWHRRNKMSQPQTNEMKIYRPKKCTEVY